ncbi:variable lymphocyte receptor a [Plakobranchus ocellatus]|uniref:Variable lymphocyte receptor a n=1 Tax=Plakobranchus ocellatus TaxID=259542 RepID=A0AAV4DQA1_9GAST|nr:variable lymphocyte receptor a [Plakobranchus ocellatus]
MRKKKIFGKQPALIMETDLKIKVEGTSDTRRGLRQKEGSQTRIGALDKRRCLRQISHLSLLPQVHNYYFYLTGFRKLKKFSQRWVSNSKPRAPIVYFNATNVYSRPRIDLYGIVPSKMLVLFIGCQLYRAWFVGNSCPSTLVAKRSSSRVGENKITKIPPEIFSKMKNLTQINLYRNEIKGIERGGFKGLMKLRALILGANLIRHIPKNIFNEAVLPQLEYLSLESNKLERIENETFCNLTRLTSLKLNNNSISYISQEGFKGLSNLIRLVLSGDKQALLDNSINISYDRQVTTSVKTRRKCGELTEAKIITYKGQPFQVTTNKLPESMPGLRLLVLDTNPWICDRNLKLVYDTWIDRQHRDTDLSSWSCKNSRHPNEISRVGDLSNEMLDMWASEEEDRTRPEDVPEKSRQSRASPRFGHSQPPLIITGICTGVAGSSAGLLSSEGVHHREGPESLRYVPTPGSGF